MTETIIDNKIEDKIDNKIEQSNIDKSIIEKPEKIKESSLKNKNFVEIFTDLIAMGMDKKECHKALTDAGYSFGVERMYQIFRELDTDKYKEIRELINTKKQSRTLKLREKLEYADSKIVDMIIEKREKILDKITDKNMETAGLADKVKSARELTYTIKMILGEETKEGQDMVNNFLIVLNKAQNYLKKNEYKEIIENGVTQFKKTEEVNETIKETV